MVFIIRKTDLILFLSFLIPASKMVQKSFQITIKIMIGNDHHYTPGKFPGIKRQYETKIQS